MPTSTVMLIYKIVDYKYVGDTILCAVGTTKYSIVNEQVTVRAVLQFFLSSFIGGRKSLKSLFSDFRPPNKSRVPLEIQSSPFSDELKSSHSASPFSLLFFSI